MIQAVTEARKMIVCLEGTTQNGWLTDTKPFAVVVSMWLLRKPKDAPT